MTVDPNETRSRGFYWVLFNWPLFQPHRKPEWQPASWDELSRSWALIGSRQVVMPGEPCILEIDERAIDRKLE